VPAAASRHARPAQRSCTRPPHGRRRADAPGERAAEVVLLGHEVQVRVENIDLHASVIDYRTNVEILSANGASKTLFTNRAACAAT
jgi:hypothetical protein